MTTMRELRRWYLANAAVPLAIAAGGVTFALFAPFDAGQRAGFVATFALLLAVHLGALTWEYGTKRKAIRAGLRRVKAEAIRRENSSAELLTHEADGCSIHTDTERGGEE